MALTNTLSALTRDKFMPVLVDNIFNSNVLCHKLLKNADMLDGGAKIIVPVEYAKNDDDNSGFLSYTASGSALSGQATGQDLSDIAQRSEWEWKTAYNSILITGEEMKMNTGSSQVLSVLKARMQNAEKTIRDLFGTSLFASSVSAGHITTLNGMGTFDGATTVASTYQDHDNGNGLIHDLGADGYNISGTETFLPQSTTAGSVCGYDRSLGGITSAVAGTNDFWNSNLGSFEYCIGTVGGESGGTALLANGTNDTGSVSFNNFCSTNSGVAGGIKAMTQMYGACTIDADQPDLIVTTQTIYDAYETALQANKRFDGDAGLADAGFQSLRFKGASVVVDSHCPAGQMYFLNTKYLDFKVHSGRNFELEDFKPLEANDVIQARIFWMGQLVCSSPRMQGLLVGGPTGY